MVQYVKCWPADQGVPGSMPAGVGNLLDRKHGSIAHSLS